MPAVFVHPVPQQVSIRAKVTNNTAIAYFASLLYLYNLGLASHAHELTPFVMD